MKYYLTIEQLQAIYACEDAQQKFTKLFGSRVRVTKKCAKKHTNDFCFTSAGSRLLSGSFKAFFFEKLRSYEEGCRSEIASSIDHFTADLLRKQYIAKLFAEHYIKQAKARNIDGVLVQLLPNLQQMALMAGYMVSLAKNENTFYVTKKVDGFAEEIQCIDMPDRTLLFKETLNGCTDLSVSDILYYMLKTVERNKRQG